MNKQNMVRYKANKYIKKIMRKKQEKVESILTNTSCKYFQQHNLSNQLGNFGIQIEKKGRILESIRDMLRNYNDHNQKYMQYISHFDKNTHQHKLDKKRCFGRFHILVDMDYIVLVLSDKSLNYIESITLWKRLHYS